MYLYVLWELGICGLTQAVCMETVVSCVVSQTFIFLTTYLLVR